MYQYLYIPNFVIGIICKWHLLLFFLPILTIHLSLCAGAQRIVFSINSNELRSRERKKNPVWSVLVYSMCCSGVFLDYRIEWIGVVCFFLLISDVCEFFYSAISAIYFYVINFNEEDTYESLKRSQYFFRWIEK